MNIFILQGRNQACYLNPRHAGRGSKICPLLVFLNNSKTVADIDTKFGVPYHISILHQMTKCCRNLRDFFPDIDAFVGSLHANLDQNRLNVKKFTKNRVLKQTAQKDQYRCNITRSTNSILKLQNFEFSTLTISK